MKSVCGIYDIRMFLTKPGCHSGSYASHGIVTMDNVYVTLINQFLKTLYSLKITLNAERTFTNRYLMELNTFIYKFFFVKYINGVVKIGRIKDFASQIRCTLCIT